MFKQMAFIGWRQDADAAEREAVADRLQAFPGAVLSVLTPVYPGSFNSGDLVWHLLFADEAAWQAAGGMEIAERLRGDPAVTHVDMVAYAPVLRGVRDAAITNGVYRGLLVSIMAGSSAEEEARFAARMPIMADYVEEIRNWGFNPVRYSSGARHWSYVWEQEFQAIADLKGPYMDHPCHWADVDRWYDPEMPEWIADIQLCHSFSTLESSIIAHYA
jgi:hypothetical protein